jgi:hypothetical protein
MTDKEIKDFIKEAKKIEKWIGKLDDELLVYLVNHATNEMDKRNYEYQKKNNREKILDILY